MADAQQPNDDILLPPLPRPPPFYRHFTTENQERLKDIKTENDLNTITDDGAPAKLTAEQILALPTELRYLIPPEPPADDDDFRVFGSVTSAKGTDTFAKTMENIGKELGIERIEENKLPFTPLKDWKYTQLYEPSTSTSSAAASSARQQHLFRLLRSLLVAYIELLGIVAINPTSDHKDQKLRNILTIVTNMHALINEYRPHQARETLILEMEGQVRRKKKEIEGVKKMKERVREVLDGFAGNVPGERGEEKEVVGVMSEEERRREAQREMWRAMEELE